MSIYFMKSDLGDAIKIGMSEDPQKRLRALSLPNAKVLAEIEGGREKEKALHERFKHLSVGGEWFTPGPDLLAYLDGLAGGDAGGVAQAVRETWRQVDRLTKLAAAVAWVLLAAGCSESATAPTPGAWVMIGFVAFVLMVAFIRATPRHPVGEDGGEVYYETEADRRARLVICRTLPGQDGGGPVLLAGDPRDQIVTELYDRTGALRGRKVEILPHVAVIPDLGLTYDVRTGETVVDERLARPGQVTRLLKAAGSWPRLAAEQAPLALPEPIPVGGAWLPPLQEFEAEKVNEEDDY